ncbi:MAG: adenylosuccinate lyase [Gemmatimonadales bacterium]|mgnify:FL=1|jgi:adenylosuccinate lyase|nr:adenylosuccinate lyase [Gemmatimonadales bacterium]MBT3499063.1 adenylosuccinate lyase [Gemmatimonadales bacterium]MBT3774207.1 adenylosuccinate lyase [Gemmatimonadales bacterium]MBT3959614.1 adenylosuccinate lyase [Gemmatimonadales bacterium]MBT4189404.1 adenylosuccinate lyase [Gemmatimonadales bacterium]
MQQVFSPANRYGTWRRLWLALAESEAELGLDISESALAQMRATLDTIDLDRAAEYEKRFRHDVMAHVHLYGDDAPDARGIIHLGATSAFIGDNTDLILHRQALQLVRARLVRCVDALSQFAEKYASLATLGFTHFQPAQPTTVGKRATLWIQDLLLDIEEIDHRLSSLRFRGVRGTTGTQASFLELFSRDHDKVDTLDLAVGQRMGFEATYPVSGQTYPRKVDYAIQASLAGAAASLSKMGHDWRLLAHLREVEEPFESEQIGSSAMPYKRNPMRAERICALTRHVIVLSQDPAFTAATQWLERTLDDSANRRVSVPDAFLALDGSLVLAENVAKGLIVNPQVVRRNLAEHLPFMATETILMHAVSRGGDRQNLHEKIRVHSMAAAGRMKEEGADADLLDRIAADEAFGLTSKELDDLVDPIRFVGRAPQQVTHFLEASVRPVLERLRGEADHLNDPEIHV